MTRIALLILGTAGDVGWFVLFGLIPWLATLGAATIEVECAMTKHSFEFKGLVKALSKLNNRRKELQCRRQK